VPIVFDNLIHKKEKPGTIGLFITPGQVTEDFFKIGLEALIGPMNMMKRMTVICQCF
jgi:hypothetical protein